MTCELGTTMQQSGTAAAQRQPDRPMAAAKVRAFQIWITLVVNTVLIARSQSSDQVT